MPQKQLTMAKEIERKFIVNNKSYREIAQHCHEICQGYLSTDPDATVRVRILDDKGFVTIKTRNQGCVRNEWEYAVPLVDACQMMEACKGRTIEKTRYIVVPEDDVKGLRWEVDEFHGRLQGLVVAEIELPSPDTPFETPSFIGREVTGDARYYNSSLSEAGSSVPEG